MRYFSLKKKHYYYWLFFQGFFQNFVFVSLVGWFNYVKILKTYLTTFKGKPFNVLFLATEPQFNVNAQIMANEFGCLMPRTLESYNKISFRYLNYQEFVRDACNDHLLVLNTTDKITTFVNKSVKLPDYKNTIIFLVGAEPNPKLVKLLTNYNFLILFFGRDPVKISNSFFNIYCNFTTYSKTSIFFRQFLNWFFRQFYFFSFSKFKSYDFKQYGKFFLKKKNIMPLTWNSCITKFKPRRKVEFCYSTRFLRFNYGLWIGRRRGVAGLFFKRLVKRRRKRWVTKFSKVSNSLYQVRRIYVFNKYKKQLRFANYRLRGITVGLNVFNK